MSKAILFDFNGVLVNDEPLHCEALIHTLAEYGIDLDRDTYYRDYLGFDDRECFRYSFSGANRPSDAASIADATERKNAAWERLVKASMPMVPGALDFVRRVRVTARGKTPHVPRSLGGVPWFPPLNPLFDRSPVPAHGRPQQPQFSEHIG